MKINFFLSFFLLINYLIIQSNCALTTEDLKDIKKILE